jgi:hypothetical protein
MPKSKAHEDKVIDCLRLSRRACEHAQVMFLQDACPRPEQRARVKNVQVQRQLPVRLVIEIPEDVLGLHPLAVGQVGVVTTKIDPK